MTERADGPATDLDIDALIDAVVPRMTALLRGADDRQARVCELAGPAQIGQAFAAAGAPLELEPGQPALDVAALARAVDTIVARSVRTRIGWSRRRAATG